MVCLSRTACLRPSLKYFYTWRHKREVYGWKVSGVTRHLRFGHLSPVSGRAASSVFHTLLIFKENFQVSLFTFRLGTFFANLENEFL